MRKVMMAIFAVSVLCSTSSEAVAQSAQRWSVQGSLLYESLYGEGFGDFDPGRGLELQVRYTSETAWSLGGGLQYTEHRYSDEDFFAGDLELVGIFLEPRYVFPRSSYAPYLSARFASTGLFLTLEEESAEAFGFTSNIGGGALLRLSPRLNLDVGATYGFTNWQSFTLGNTELEDTGGSGTNLIIRLGLAFGF